MDRTQVIIVRHGETEWNIAGIRQGHLDSELKEQQVALVNEIRIGAET